MSKDASQQQATSESDQTSEELLKETKWTDSAIRWSEDENKATEEDDDEESTGLVDPFADPDPSQRFDFEFDVNDSAGGKIRLSLDGYKYESDETWQSTGLTLWRAARHLCDYLVQHLKDEQEGKTEDSLFRDKQILEVSL